MHNTSNNNVTMICTNIEANKSQKHSTEKLIYANHSVMSLQEDKVTYIYICIWWLMFVQTFLFPCTHGNKPTSLKNVGRSSTASYADVQGVKHLRTRCQHAQCRRQNTAQKFRVANVQDNNKWSIVFWNQIIYCETLFSFPIQQRTKRKKK